MIVSLLKKENKVCDKNVIKLNNYEWSVYKNKEQQACFMKLKNLVWKGIDVFKTKHINEKNEMRLTDTIKPKIR